MKINNNKGEIMNKFTKVGISALAGSLVAISAQAVEMSAAGSAKLTYTGNDSTETIGNPFGMNTSVSFSGTGEVNGYETTLLVTAADQFSGMSSASLSVDLGDMGKVTFDQGVGAGGISTIDDKTPTANEEVWDGLDAVTGTANGLVGGGNGGVFVYANSYSGANLSVQLSKGDRTSHTDDGAKATTGSGGSSWDFALTSDTLMDGVSAGVGHGQIANGAQTGTGSDVDKHSVAFVNYSMGMATVGFSMAKVDKGITGKSSEAAQAFGLSLNVNDNLSLSYGEREIEYEHDDATNVTEDISGIAVAYTMGSAKISLQMNETDNNGGTANVKDENTEVALSLSF